MGKKIIKLSDLGLSSDTENFRKFMFQGRIIDNQIFYFDNIKLVKSNYEDKGECYDNENSNRGNHQKFVTFDEMFWLLYMFLIF